MSNSETNAFTDIDTSAPAAAKGPRSRARDNARLEGAACCLSGLLVGTAIGAIVGRLSAGAWTGEQVIIGVVVGAVAGLIFGRKIAAIPSVLGGAAFGAFVPLALIVLDGLRRGRLDFKAIQSPEFFPILGAIAGGGALLGALLVGTRKLLVRLLSRPADVTA